MPSKMTKIPTGADHKDQVMDSPDRNLYEDINAMAQSAN